MAADDGSVILVYMHMHMHMHMCTCRWWDELPGTGPTRCLMLTDWLAVRERARAAGQDTAIDLAAVGGKGLSNAAGDGRVQRR